MTGSLGEGPPRGRRAGISQTRDDIRRHALGLFAAHGYNGASIRAIASAAGVDPSLVIHFYGSKEALFTATLDLLGSIPERLSAAIAGGRAGLGPRLAEVYLGLWEDPATAAQMQALFRSVTTNKDAAAIVRGVLEARVFPTAAELSDRLAARLPIAMTQLLGVSTARYVLDVEPLTTMTRQELTEIVGRAVEATLAD